MEQIINEIDNKRTEITKKYDDDINILKNGLLLLENDEIPQAVRDAIFKDIETNFFEKWTLYKLNMKQLDDRMEEFSHYY
jgi:uncharacterized Fe-S cluster-containing MiaB family protein